MPSKNLSFYQWDMFLYMYHSIQKRKYMIKIQETLFLAFDANKVGTFTVHQATGICYFTILFNVFIQYFFQKNQQTSMTNLTQIGLQR